MNISITQIKKIKKRYIIIGAIILLIVFSIIKNKAEEKASRDIFSVEIGKVEETITLSGDVTMKDRVDLGFGFSGRVASVLVQSGDIVKEGDVLAKLSMASLQAEFLEAQSALTQAKADSGASNINLDFAYQTLQNTIAQYDTLVDNAYRALLNESLEAYTEKNTTTPAPVISGTYNATEQGEYVISGYASASSSGYSFNISGLENDSETAKTTTPGPLGTKGLFVQFTPGVSYSNIVWTVSIPNIRSVNYTAKKNAYDQAVAERTSAVASAQNTYLQTKAQESNENSISKSEASIQGANARVSGVLARMSDGVIKAPSDGIVGSIDLRVGEIVSPNTSYVTLVGSEQFEVELYVPEIDVAKLSEGDNVTITLDAYNDDSSWQGVIETIDAIDTVVDGVSVYKTTVTITNPDERIRVGMSAKATILAQQKDSVLRAPLYFFVRTEKGFEVQILNEKDRVSTKLVTLGLVGSDGFVEILDGLSPGDRIVGVQK